MIPEIRFEFVLFGLTLLGIAIFHHRTLQVAVGGLVTIVLYKLIATGFDEGAGLVGLALHLEGEWVVLANLLALLVGFGLLADHFEGSGVPAVLPRYLPQDWTGALAMLLIVFVMSSFLDNIAAAMIGGAMAHTLFRRRVHIGYVAGIVAAANAGGAGSVVGDTTTTMMWIAGVSPVDVLHAYLGSFVALLAFGIPAAIVQQRHSPISRGAAHEVAVDWGRMLVVGIVLVSAVATNVTVNLRLPGEADRFPFIGTAVIVALIATSRIRRPAWQLVPSALRTSLFLLSLVTCASLMPVETLPGASWPTAFGLGIVSSFFDNIPLTALALQQNGYDWGVLAYAVGFGGSMIWFGSSAGVAVATLYPEARSVGAWLRHGWFVAVAYGLGFAVLILGLGWRPVTL